VVQKHKVHDVEQSAVVQPKSQQTVPAQSQGEQVVHPAKVLQRTAAAFRPADVLALQRTVGNRAVQRMLIQRTEEVEPLKGHSLSRRFGIENLSGMSMDGVRVHYNSAESAERNALAYTQGTQLPLGPSEDELFRHEVSHVGQRRLGRVRPTLQMKLAVGPVDDHYEREADRVAATVMQTSQPPAPQIQRQGLEEEDQTIQTKPLASTITPLIQRQETSDEEEDMVQRRSDPHSERSHASVDSGLENVIERTRGGGQPLPDGLLARMQRSFGADFSAVRVHADSESDSLNHSLRARAFTTGHDLFFRRGEYNPHSRRGQELIAHELTHVVQQNGGASGKKNLSLQRSASNVIQRSWWTDLKEWFGAVPRRVDEARGFYDADPAGVYGNIPGKTGKEAQRENYNRDDKRDLGSYSLLGVGATSAVAKVVADRAHVLKHTPKDFFTENAPIMSETGKWMSGLGIASAGAGTATSLVDTYKGFREFRDTGATKEQQRIGFLAGTSGLASATQQSATTAFHAANLAGNPAMAATAQLVAGGAGVATGAVDVLRGIYAHSKADDNIFRLQNFQTRQARRHDNLGKVAQQAESTQRMRKETARYTIGKGLLTAVGGGLLLAGAALSPIGWLLIGAGGILAAWGAWRKYNDKQKRAKEIAIRELEIQYPGLEEDQETWENLKTGVEKETWRWFGSRDERMKQIGPSPLDQKLKELKFVNVGHFYANFIHKTANEIYDAGVMGRDRLEAPLRAVLARLPGSPRAKQKVLMRLRGMSYDEMSKKYDLPAAQPGNPYFAVVELLAGMGLKFDFQKDPPEPSPEKIGKVLHD